MSWCLGLGRNSWSVGSWRLLRVFRAAVGEGPPEPFISSKLTCRRARPKPDTQSGRRREEGTFRGGCDTKPGLWAQKLNQTEAMWRMSPAPARHSSVGFFPPLTCCVSDPVFGMLSLLCVSWGCLCTLWEAAQLSLQL